MNIALTDGNILRMGTGPMKARLNPETENLSFVKQAPVTWDFIKGTDVETFGSIVRENGKVFGMAVQEKSWSHQDRVPGAVP